MLLGQALKENSFLGTNTRELINYCCGFLIAADGSHEISCSLCPGVFARQAALNDLICRRLNHVCFPTMTEARGISRTNGKRPE